MLCFVPKSSAKPTQGGLGGVPPRKTGRVHVCVEDYSFFDGKRSRGFLLKIPRRGHGSLKSGLQETGSEAKNASSEDQFGPHYSAEPT
jgi:hypothetical protein